MSGSVGAVSRRGVTIECALGKFLVKSDKASPPPAGSTVGFAVSADLVQIGRKKPKTDNAVACSLISEEFIGSVVTLFLEADDGTEFKVQLQERELSALDLHASDAFHIGWNAADAHLLGET